MNYFENIDLFSELSQKDQVSLSDFCQIISVWSGETLFRQGDEPQALYVVASGSFSVIQNIDGIDTRIARVWSGELLWEMAFFHEPPKRNATVIADEDSQVVVILQFSIQDLFEKHPSIHASFKEIIEERVRKNSNL